MANKDRVLVYSDDPKDRKILDGSLQKELAAAEQTKLIAGNSFVAVFRIEKNGRGGKTVTVLDKLPSQDEFLKDLTKEFKTKCGVGGSYKVQDSVGMIEIQGDNREKMKKILDGRNIKYKGL